MSKREIGRASAEEEKRPCAALPRQRELPGVNSEDFKTFKDLSRGAPTSKKCPRCGYEW